MNQIYILCTDKFEYADIVVMNADNVINKINNVSLSEISQKLDLKESKIAILLASPEIVLKDITIPKGIGNTTLSKIIPNMLEDSIMSNTENIHFSHNKLDKTHCGIAWVDKDKMNAWKAHLNEYGITPSALYPLCASLPCEPLVWRIWVKNDIATAKVSPFMGFSVEKQQLAQLLNYFYVTQSDLPQKIILSTPENISDLLAEFEAYPNLKKIIEVNTQNEFPFKPPQRIDVNLINDRPSKKELFEKYKPLALHAGILFGLIFVFAVIQKIIYIKNYSDMNKEQTAAIEMLYKRLYPQATQVTSPKLRMEQELKQISGQGPFFDLLYTVGNILQPNKQITLKSLNYYAKKLKIVVEANNYADIEAFINQLKTKKIQFEHNKLEQSENKVKTEFTISKGQ